MESEELNAGGYDDSGHSGHGQEHIRENASEQLDGFSDLHERNHIRHTESIHRVTDTTSITGNRVDPTVPCPDRKRQSTRPRQHLDMLAEMQQKISSLERQLKSISQTTIQAGRATQASVSNLQGDEQITPRSSGAMPSEQVSMVAEVNEATWTNFMQKFGDDDKEYAIEVLIGEPEDQRISSKTMRAKKTLNHGFGLGLENATTSTKHPHSLKISSSVPERIRINSPYILGALSEFDETIDANSPIIMLGPYKLLMHYEDRIRELTLSSRHRSLEREQSLERQGLMNGELEINGQLSLEQDAHDGIRAQHLQCLIYFIDHYLKPASDLLRTGDPQKVHFRDLWYLFAPGDDIFMPFRDRQHRLISDSGKITPEILQGRYERTWRVLGTGGGRTNMLMASDRDSRIRQNPFQVNCYYIDFDGRYYCPVVHQFDIQPFSGERDIKSLEFFPRRYAGLDGEFTKHYLLISDALQHSHTHFYYRGPTMTTHPCGCALQDGQLHQEEIESEVIVDYRTTLLKLPGWRPKSCFWKKPPCKTDEVQGKHRVYHYRDRAKSQLTRTEIDQIYDDNTIDLEIALSYKDKARIFDPVPSGWLSNDTAVPEADLYLLSARVFVFVLRTRSFAPVWMWGLQKISAQTDGLRNLQLRDNSFKDTVHALVRTHFLQTNSHREPDSEFEIIQAKRQGLVLLLHGMPGVGKTFTAESVAAANGRPLLQITCGDLGLTPTEVERALKEIFQYAQLWNCVLLLDECDIFLTQRTKADLKRNSLVSVFLKVLEWYSGVLFLTTNRVGALDSAVRSRITWSIYYPPFDWAQTKEIWKTGLEVVEKRHIGIEVEKKSIMKFAKRHFQSTITEGSNWNGRQIQNAFKVAISLADWDTMTGEERQATSTGMPFNEEDRKPKLSASHFNVVAEAAAAFDVYLLQATGLTEAQRAWNAQERADDYQDEEETSETNGNNQVPEPLAKRRRLSSMTINMPAPQYDGSNIQLPPQSNSGRRPSSSSATRPPILRKMSQQQQQQQQQQQESSNRRYRSKNPGIPSPGANDTNMTLSPLQTQASFSNNKRKRSTADVSGVRRGSKIQIDTGCVTDEFDEPTYTVNDSLGAERVDKGVSNDYSDSDSD